MTEARKMSLVGSEAGLRIVECEEPKPFTWDDVRGRMNAGIAERKRASVWMIALRLGFVLNALVMLALLIVGAFTVGHWVHGAWRDRVSLETVQANAVRRTH